MTVAEANAAMDAGLAGNLMRDWFFPDKRLGNEENIYMLCPATIGRGGLDAPQLAEMFGIIDISDAELLSCILTGIVKRRSFRCGFLTDDKRCAIHESGFKPIVCREALRCNKQIDAGAVHKIELAPEWDTDAGRATVARWYALNASNERKVASA
jgi:hypothetical protein